MREEAERLVKKIEDLYSTPIEGREDEWYAVYDEVMVFSRRTDKIGKEKVVFGPLGYGETMGMIIDGIDYERKTGRYAEMTDDEKEK